MKIHAGILDVPTKPRRDDEHELALLAATPGIPFEWVVHAAKLNDIHSSTLKRNVRTADPDQAAANAASVTAEDAFRMMEVIRPEYRGAIPLYSQLWLKSSPLTDANVAEMLGLKPGRIWRWRTTINFDPLTGVRL